MPEEPLREIDVVPIRESHIESFRACLDSVARERRFLGMLEAPPLESVAAFVNGNIQEALPQFVAVGWDQLVVGWCDVTPPRSDGFTHTGALGMGVHRDYRGRGLGSRLLEATLARAREFGLERVELEVYASNLPAIRLYERWGFEREGVKRRARKLAGEYDDLVLMAILFNESATRFS